MTAVAKIIELARRIASGEYDKAQTVEELERIEDEFDNPYLIWDVKRTKKPWTKAYLVGLKDEVISGAASKEQLLYMSEVSDYVYRRTAALRVTNCLYRILMRLKRTFSGLPSRVKRIISIVIFAIVGILVFFRCLGDR